MTVAGLDISLTGTGVMLSNSQSYLVGVAGVTKLPLLQRMEVIDGLAATIAKKLTGTYLVVVELPNLRHAYGGQMERAWLWYETVRWLRMRGILVAAATDSQRSQFLLGKGNATKGQIIEGVTRRWPDLDTRGDDNLADAAVYMEMGRARLGHDVNLPAKHLEVLGKIDWPEGT